MFHGVFFVIASIVRCQVSYFVIFYKKGRARRQSTWKLIEVHGRINDINIKKEEIKDGVQLK